MAQIDTIKNSEFIRQCRFHLKIRARGKVIKVISSVEEGAAESRVPGTVVVPTTSTMNAEQSLHRNVKVASTSKGSSNECECPKCGKSLSSKLCLRRHIKATHSDGRPFECNVCKMKFQDSPNLRRHTLLHSCKKPIFLLPPINRIPLLADKIPFKCDVCGKPFKTQKYLKRHKQIHSNNRPSFKCDITNDDAILERRQFLICREETFFLHLKTIDHSNKTSVKRHTEIEVIGGIVTSFIAKMSIFRSQLIFFISCILHGAIVAAQESPPTDFLQDHIPIYVAIVIGLFALQSVVLFLMGQPLLPSTGLVFFYNDIYGPGNSQNISDWYTFTHILHGFIFYYVTYGIGLLLPVITVNYGYLISLSSAVTWEIVENTPCVINRYRQTAAAAGYNGDSVINSFCDSIACTLGFWISFFTPWWVILVLGIAEEILLAIIIRDNLIINILQIVFSFKCISDWQAAKAKPKAVSTSEGTA
ncbi:UPF0314 protein [Pseudolycoriella hygida]|uniref:UPF0314 protein n=1 Tax=Pseudolycoriella hygida TaxID=35572 RepID=A0A9Q0S711_9DIPT|nr:UPF0314 protein [Pseudolycoriella hygida]